MKNQHPSYPTPTIQEAVCEIHFRLPDGVTWTPALFGDLFKQINADYPELEPVTQMAIEFEVGPERMGQTLRPLQQRMRYKHGSRNLRLQLSPEIFTVNVLPPYPGWQQMLQDIHQAWDNVRSVIRPSAIARIGLRYINRIDLSQPAESPGAWIAPNDYVPKAVLTSLPGFFSRLETRTSKDHRLIVTLGEIPTDVGPQSRAIVLDIDCIVEKAMGTERQVLDNELERLHEESWRVFDASRTSRLETLLNTPRVQR